MSLGDMRLPQPPVVGIAEQLMERSHDVYRPAWRSRVVGTVCQTPVRGRADRSLGCWGSSCRTSVAAPVRAMIFDPSELSASDEAVFENPDKSQPHA